MKNSTRDRVLLSGFIPPNHLDKDAMQQYKDCGFNICFMTENYYKVNSPEYFESLKLMEEMGIDACVTFYKAQTGKYHEHFKNIDLHDYPAVKMIHVLDEPDDDLIRKVSEIYVPWFNENYSDLDFFMNTFGGCGAEVSGLDKFSIHLNKCIGNINNKAKAKNKFFSIDSYPLRITGGWDGNFLLSSAYLLGLAAGAEIVSKTDSLFGGCIQTYSGYMNCRYPDSIADIRFQNFCQFAYGVRSLCYFTYMTEETPLYLFRGMVTAKGKPTELYHIVKQANQEITTFEKDYMHFDWLGTMVIDGEKVNENAKDFAFIRSDIRDYKDDNVLDISAERDLLFGCFGDDDNKRAYVITTYSEPSKGLDNKVSITFKNGKTAKINFNGKDEVRTLVDGKLELNMKDGDGAFIVIE